MKRRLLQRCQQLGLRPYEDTPRQPEGVRSDRRETTAREDAPAPPRKAAKRVPRRVCPSRTTLQAAARTRSEDEGISKQRLQEETVNDALLNAVMGYVNSQWPPAHSVNIHKRPQERAVPGPSEQIPET
ncbi:hypothetical protein HPB47_005907 [Ixodes persulcatus]|uniref:Uncharacterized protein n=1 Tax=Ixodes persulcatus TaxID=34615 RepID=A0AC60PC14_IXOPE|nr:hypothetical protein HPB47_005907 [Ixodes persulcatus]